MITTKTNQKIETLIMIEEIEIMNIIEIKGNLESLIDKIM